MYQNVIFYIVERLFELENRKKIISIIHQENYEDANFLITNIFTEEAKKHLTIETPQAILMRNLQCQLLEKNNNSIYKTLFELQQLEENIAIITLYSTKLKKITKGHLYLISTCLSEIQQKIQDIANLQIKTVMIKIILQFYLENKQPSSIEVTDILKKTTLDYKALLGCQILSENESYSQYHLSDYDKFNQENLGTELKEDKIDEMEATRYWLYQKVNNQYKKIIRKYVNQEVIVYLQRILGNWILEESKKDSTSDLKIVPQIWKEVLQELNKICSKQQKKDSNTEQSVSSNQLDIWEYQKKLIPPFM